MRNRLAVKVVRPKLTTLHRKLDALLWMMPPPCVKLTLPSSPPLGRRKRERNEEKKSSILLRGRKDGEE